MTLEKRMRIFLATAIGVFVSGAPAASAAGNLITADKTVFIQFAIFLVALYILNALFFKPLMELADKRERATSGSGREADELAAKTEEIAAKYEAALKDAREQALAERARLTKSAAAEADGIVSSAREEARSLFEKRAEELAARTEKARAGMSAEIEEIARVITRAAGGKGV